MEASSYILLDRDPIAKGKNTEDNGFEMAVKVTSSGIGHSF